MKLDDHFGRLHANIKGANQSDTVMVKSIRVSNALIYVKHDGISQIYGDENFANRIGQCLGYSVEWVYPQHQKDGQAVLQPSMLSL